MISMMKSHPSHTIPSLTNSYERHYPRKKRATERLFPEAVVLVNAAAETTTWSTFLSYA